MQKEKKIKTYQRKTKSGKVATVKAHTAKYNASDMAKEALKHAKGAGKEFEKGGTTLTELEKLLKAAEDMTLKGPEVYSSDKWMEHNSKIQKYIQKNNISEAQFNKVVKKYGLDVNYEGYAPKKETKLGVGDEKEMRRKSAKEILKEPLEKGYNKKNWQENKKRAKEYLKKSKVETPDVNPAGESYSPGSRFEKPISQADYKAWYHWDPNKDPKNAGAIRAEKALKEKMGTKMYNEYYNKVVDSYSSRGHLKSYQSLEPAESSRIHSAKMRKGTAKAQKEIAEKMGAKDAAAKFDKIAGEGKSKKGTSPLMKGEKKGDTDSYFGTGALNSAYKKSLDAIKSGDPKQVRKVLSDYADIYSHHGDHFEDKKSDKYREGLRKSLEGKLSKIGLDLYGFKLKDKNSPLFTKEKESKEPAVKAHPKVVGWKKKNGTEVAEYATEKSKRKSSKEKKKVSPKPEKRKPDFNKGFVTTSITRKPTGGRR